MLASRRIFASLFLATLALHGCNGRLGALNEASEGTLSRSAGDGDGDGDRDSGQTGVGTDPTDPRLQARAWRLTPAQYNREIQKMFPGAPMVLLPQGPSEYGFTNISELAWIDQGNVSQYTEAARLIGNWVATTGSAAARCDSFGSTECVDQFLDWFLDASYRRAPTEEEKRQLRSLYDDLAADFDADFAFAGMVRAVLLGPQFVYRSEVGQEGTGVVELEQHEVASLLAFALTDEGPDQELREAIALGTLDDPDVREAHARRLMDDSGVVWQRFFWEWLKMSSLESQGAELAMSGQLIGELEQEYLDFVERIVVTERGNLTDLMTSTTTWGSPALADYYGASHSGNGTEGFELDPSQRGGLLTLGSWLVAHGKDGRDNIVRRGMGVFIDAMCNEIEPIAIDLEEAEAELVGENPTPKEVSDARSTTPPCAGCHSTSDPVGLAFEVYAGDGSWQTEWADGVPVDASVMLDGAAHDGAVSISAMLADNESFQHCLVQRFGHFVMGHEFGSPIEVRAPRAALEAFVESGGSFEELLIAIVRDPSFIERRKS